MLNCNLCLFYLAAHTGSATRQRVVQLSSAAFGRAGHAQVGLIGAASRSYGGFYLFFSFLSSFLTIFAYAPPAFSVPKKATRLDSIHLFFCPLIVFVLPRLTAFGSDGSRGLRVCDRAPGKAIRL